MRHLPDSDTKQLIAVNTSVASGVNAVITLAAQSPQSGVAEYHVIDWITWSYKGTPTTGEVQINTGSKVLKHHITTSGPGQLMFGDRGLLCDANTAATITLLNGSQEKHLAVQYR